MNRIIWGYVKTFFVTYFFVLGTEPEWTTWHHVWFSLWLAWVGAFVGLVQTFYDFTRKPTFAWGAFPGNLFAALRQYFASAQEDADDATAEEDDIDNQPI